MRSSTLSVSEGDRITMEEYAFVSQNHNSRGRKVLVIYCQKWLADRSVVRSTSDYMSDVLARGADRELVRIFEKSEENVLKAYQLSNHLLVLGWIQITEDLQRGVEDSIKEHNAKEDLEEQYEAHGDDAPETDKARDILDYWSCAVSSMKESARCQAAMLPQVSGIVDPWKRIVESSEPLVEPWIESMRTAVPRTISVEPSWNHVVDVASPDISSLSTAKAGNADGCCVRVEF